MVLANTVAIIAITSKSRPPKAKRLGILILSIAAPFDLIILDNVHTPVDLPGNNIFLVTTRVMVLGNPLYLFICKRTSNSAYTHQQTYPFFVLLHPVADIYERLVINRSIEVLLQQKMGNYTQEQYFTDVVYFHKIRDMLSYSKTYGGQQW